MRVDYTWTETEMKAELSSFITRSYFIYRRRPLFVDKLICLPVVQIKLIRDASLDGIPFPKPLPRGAFFMLPKNS